MQSCHLHLLDSLGRVNTALLSEKTGAFGKNSTPGEPTLRPLSCFKCAPVAPSHRPTALGMVMLSSRPGQRPRLAPSPIYPPFFTPTSMADKVLLVSLDGHRPTPVPPLPCSNSTCFPPPLLWLGVGGGCGGVAGPTPPLSFRLFGRSPSRAAAACCLHCEFWEQGGP